MADGMSGMKIEMLGRDGNFAQWFGQIEAALIIKGWDEYLTEEPSEDDPEEVRGDRRCKALLQAYTTGVLNNVVRNAGTARQAWDLLHEEYRGEISVRKIDLLRKATEMRQGDLSIQKYIDKVRVLREEFRAVSLEDEMGLLTTQFVKGLRPTILSSVGTQLGTEVTRGADLDTICTNLRSLVTFLPGRGGDVGHAAVARVGGGFKGKCHYCGKQGHPHRDCRKKKADRDAGKKLVWSRDNEKKSEPAHSGVGAALCVKAARVAAATVRVDDRRRDRLVFDTGATHNFVKELSMLHDKHDSPVEIVLMGGKEMHHVACMRRDGGTTWRTPRTSDPERSTLCTDNAHEPSVRRLCH